MNPSIITESISSLQVSDVQNLKGGEKTTSEWEELEKLSKDDLIIELVKERYKRRLIDHRLRMIVELDYPVEKQIPLFSDDEDECEGMTSEDWAYRIARYAYEHCEDKSDFDPYCPMDYGLDEDQSTEAYRRLRADGIITDSSKDLVGWF